MLTTALMLSAVVPSLALLWFFYSRDEYPEPPRIVATVFLLGVATIPLVLGFGAIVERVLGDWPSDPYVGGLVDAFVYAALPEEALKLAILLLYVRRQSAFDEPMDGLVYGVAASLGFATLENVMYVSTGDLRVAVVRAVTAVPCHATLGAIMGYYVARATFEPSGRLRSLVAAAVVPTFFHTLYDFPLLAIARFDDPGVIPDLVGRGLTGLAFGVLGFMVLWAHGLAREQQRQQVGRGASKLNWARLSLWLHVGLYALLAGCGALMLIGSLAAPDTATMVGITLLALGLALLLEAIRTGPSAVG